MSKPSIPDDVEVSYSPDADVPQMSEKIASIGPKLVDQWSPESPFVTLVRTTQGTGKSTGLAERIAYYCGFTAMFAPRHRDIDQDLESPLGEIFKHHFEGKDRVCDNRQYKGKHALVSNSVSQDWCEGCSKKNQCQYFDAYRAVWNWDPQQLKPDQSEISFAPHFMAVHQHIDVLPELFSPDEGNAPWDHVEAVLIDESPYDTLVVDNHIIELKDLQAELDVLNQIDVDGTNIKGLIDEAIDVVETTQNCLIEGEDSETIYCVWKDLYIKYRDHKEAFNSIVGDQWGKQTDRNGTPIVFPTLNAISNTEQVIQSSINDDRTINESTAIENLWDVSSGDKPALTVSYADLKSLRSIASQKPVFVLATEWPRQIAETVFDLPIVEVTDDLKPEMDVLQLRTNRAGITVLREKGRLYHNLLDLTVLATKVEHENGEKTLVVSKKELKEEIHEKLTSEGLERGEDYKLTHYYGLTGSNQYTDCGAVVIHGAPGYPDDLLHLNRLMTGIPEDDLEFEKCQGEIRDALHRIRPAQKDGVRAYIWTDDVQFHSEFEGRYLEQTVPQLRDKLTSKLSAIEKKKAKEQHVLQLLNEWNGWMTGTEFKNEVGGQYISVRDDLVNDGHIEKVTESTGPGRPTQKYRVQDL